SPGRLRPRSHAEPRFPHGRARTAHRSPRRACSPIARYEVDLRLSGYPQMTSPMLPSRFFAAYALDWIAGDPPDMPHPVRFIGAAISHGERLLRRPATPSMEIVRGAFLTALIVSGAWASARFVRSTGPIAEILLGWTTLATRSLLDESAAVVCAVEAHDL